MIRGNFDLRVAPADGSAPAQDLIATELNEAEWEWSPDGRSALFDAYQQPSADIWLADASRPEERRALLASPLIELKAELSRDGRWVAYQSGGDLYVARFPDLQARTLVAQAGREARWSAASPELFYIQAGRVMSVRYEARPDSLRLFPVRPLFELPRIAGESWFEVSPDASRFLVLVPVPGQPRSKGSSRAGRLRRAAEAAGRAGKPMTQPHSNLRQQPQAVGGGETRELLYTRRTLWCSVRGARRRPRARCKSQGERRARATL
jgi:hypothetical protein